MLQKKERTTKKIELVKWLKKTAEEIRLGIIVKLGKDIP